MILNKYPILCRYGHYNYNTNKDKLKKVPDGDRDFNSPYAGNFVLTGRTGYMVEKIKERDMHMKIRDNLYPPVGPVTEQILIELRSSGDVWAHGKYYEKLLGSGAVSGYFVSIINHMTFHDEWHDMGLYRIFALNEFLEHGGSKTFGEYVESHSETIDELFKVFKINMYSHTVELLSACSSDYLINYRPYVVLKIDKIFNTLTVSEVLKLIEMSDSEPRINKSNYFRLFNDRVTEIRSMVTLKSPDELCDDLLRAMILSVDTFGTGNLSMSRIVSDFIRTNRTFINNINMIKKQFIVKTIEKLAKDITPVEMLSLVSALGNSKFAFRSADTEKAVAIVYEAFSKLDNPLDFVIFINEIVLHHDGLLASYGEWMKSIKNGDDYTIGPILALSLMTSDAKSNLAYKIPYEVSEYRRVYQNWTEVESDKNG